MRPKGNAVVFKAGDEVDVDVMDDLSGVFTVVHIDIHAVGLHAFFDCVCEFTHGFLYLTPELRRRFEHVRRVLFWDYQRMSWVRGLNREEGERRIVLVHAYRRQLAAYDFAENAVGFRSVIHEAMLPKIG